MLEIERVFVGISTISVGELGMYSTRERERELEIHRCDRAALEFETAN